LVTKLVERGLVVALGNNAIDKALEPQQMYDMTNLPEMHWARLSTHT
jgi:hypothetical protein